MILQKKSINGKSPGEFSGVSKSPATPKTPGNGKRGRGRPRKHPKDQQDPSLTKKQEQFDMCSPNSLLCEVDLKVKIFLLKILFLCFSLNIECLLIGYFWVKNSLKKF